MRQRWIDPLLRFDQGSLGINGTYAVLDQNLIQNLWRPDSYIENMKSLKFSFQAGPFINQGFRLFPNGMVLVSSRISSTLSCAMEFTNFPMDKQSCPITLSSYFFTEEDLYYDWGEVYIYDGVEMNQFDILGVESKRSSLKFTSGVYSSLKATFKFRRRIQNFMLGFYIPSILTVMLSWVSFFISPNSAPARCALGIITVLAIGGFLTGQRKSFPTVSYVMAADSFILICYVFAFLALLEYAAVHYFFVYDKQLYQMNKAMGKKMKGNTNENFIDEGEYEPGDEEEEEEVQKTEKAKPKEVFVTPIEAFNSNSADMTLPTTEKKGKKKRSLCNILYSILTWPSRLFTTIKEDALIIDKVARVVFPLSFAIFNVIYWSIYKTEHNSDVLKH
ncbi:glycine receptor subunit alpha-3-like isoform X2 [Actinia tenebrosa]|nr:glycine receptor subunit alpha-3-like isoform X2 [Actinia tenebrosa]